MSYDAASRLVGQLYPTGRLNTYTYDAAGHRTVMADATGLTTTTFDPLYRTSLVANPAGKTVSYTYDLADRRRTMTSPAGGLFTYTFDPAGNLTQVTNPQGKATTTTYDPLNRPALKQMANGAAVSQTWDAAGRLTTLANFGSGGGLVNCFTYTYDAADNRLTMTEALGSQTVWTYDPTRQLLAETRTAGIATIAWVPLSGPQWQGLSLNDWSAMLLDTDYPRVVYCTTYTYDPAGNRILQNDSGQLTTYTYDDTNQLLTLQNPAGVTTYTSDADGNRTQQNAPSSVTYYSWDEDDRLIEAEPVAGVVAFTYNADGQRMVKTAPASTTRFIYDFQRLLEETDGSGATENQYTYVNNGFGDLVSEYDTSDTTYHAYDAQHSTDSLLDDSGSTIDVYKYKAFGLAQAQIGTSQTPFTYVGQQGYYQDAELELYYLGMGGGPPAGRAYDPSTGRFLTPDPTGFTAGDANLYRCVGNNPVESDDPAGHEDPELLRWSQKRVKRLKQLETRALARGDSDAAALARAGYLREERLHPVGCPHQQLKASGADSGTPNDSASGTAKRRGQSGHDVADVEDRDLRKAIARADLANAAYEGVGLTDWARREGWTQVGDQHVLEGTTFRALLFKNTKSGEYVLSFKGTATANDVVNDVEQGESLDAAQYDEAIELTRRLKAKYGPMLSLTGHSLGGGLASAAAIVNNIHAITFNAAGVSAATVERHGAQLAPGVANAFIDAYRVVGEPLSTGQDQPRVLRGLVGLGAGTLVFPPLAVPAGVMAAAAPYGTGNAHWLYGRDTGLKEKHSMDNVIYGLEAEFTRRGICIGR